MGMGERTSTSVTALLVPIMATPAPSTNSNGHGDPSPSLDGPSSGAAHAQGNGSSTDLLATSKSWRSALCVFCGSSAGKDPAFVAAAKQVGEALSRAQIPLVYGGGTLGLVDGCRCRCYLRFWRTSLGNHSESTDGRRGRAEPTQGGCDRSDPTADTGQRGRRERQEHSHPRKDDA